MKIEDLGDRLILEWPGRIQPVALGSYGRVEAARRLRLTGPMTIVALVGPTLPEARDQCVLSRWSPDRWAGFALPVGPESEVGEIAGWVRLATGRPLPARRRRRIWMVIDPARGPIEVGQAALDPPAKTRVTGPLRFNLPTRALRGSTPAGDELPL